MLSMYKLNIDNDMGDILDTLDKMSLGSKKKKGYILLVRSFTEI